MRNWKTVLTTAAMTALMSGQLIAKINVITTSSFQTDDTKFFNHAPVLCALITGPKVQIELHAEKDSILPIGAKFSVKWAKDLTCTTNTEGIAFFWTRADQAPNKLTMKDMSDLTSTEASLPQALVVNAPKDTKSYFLAFLRGSAPPGTITKRHVREYSGGKLTKESEQEIQSSDKAEYTRKESQGKVEIKAGVPSSEEARNVKARNNQAESIAKGEYLEEVGTTGGKSLFLHLQYSAKDYRTIKLAVLEKDKTVTSLNLITSLLCSETDVCVAHRYLMEWDDYEEQSGNFIAGKITSITFAPDLRAELKKSVAEKAPVTR